MKEDSWTNCHAMGTLGVTGPLGSPRAWLRRAFDATSLDDTVFQHNSLTPYEISVAGIWYKPCTLPLAGEHRTLYRYFDVPSAAELHRNIRRETLLPVIGVAAAVPMDQIMSWIKTARASGAAFTWWKTPEDKSQRDTNLRSARNQLDHAKIYQLLDQGLTRNQIALQLNYPRNNVDYVARKWENEIPLTKQQTWANKIEMIEDFRSGIPVILLAEKYKKSPSYIHKVIKAHRNT